MEHLDLETSQMCVTIAKFVTDKYVEGPKLEKSVILSGLIASTILKFLKETA